MSTLHLSVVIPAYNESENFTSGVLNPVLGFLSHQKYSWELIFVDDGSTDDTFKLLSTLSKTNKQIRVLKISHGGKAAAVTHGLLSATGDYILFTDFDQSTPIPQVTKFLKAHSQGADVVIGVRSVTQKDTLVHKIISTSFLLLVQAIALPGIKDSQCGFKSFTRASAQKIFSSLTVCRPRGKITGAYMGAFDVEVLFLAKKFGLTISEVPVTWIKFPSNRLNIWTEPLHMLLDVIKIRLYD